MKFCTTKLSFKKKKKQFQILLCFFFPRQTRKTLRELSYQHIQGSIQILQTIFYALQLSVVPKKNEHPHACKETHSLFPSSAFSGIIFILQQEQRLFTQIDSIFPPQVRYF